MSVSANHAQLFAEIIRAEHPALIQYLVTPPERVSQSQTIFKAFRPNHSGEYLFVEDRGDTIEIGWSFPGTRGPAEWYWIENHHQDQSLARDAVDAVISILNGVTTVTIRRHRLFWFPAYLSAEFSKPAAPVSTENVIAIVRWSDTTPETLHP